MPRGVTPYQPDWYQIIEAATVLNTDATRFARLPLAERRFWIAKADAVTDIRNTIQRLQMKNSRQDAGAGAGAGADGGASFIGAR